MLSLVIHNIGQKVSRPPDGLSFGGRIRADVCGSEDRVEQAAARPEGQDGGQELGGRSRAFGTCFACVRPCEER